jgi:REP element-mobilizing transposase RayT
MTRPLRLEFAGALYHITSRGDRRALIYLDDTDRAFWLQALAEACARFHFVVHSFCQMGNHFHLLLETQEPNLSKGMRQLNGTYSQYFNRRHDLVGHVFQGRYQAILVQEESYLLELARYIVLNPVRANMVARPEDWPWSSYRLMTGTELPPAWLNTQGILGRLNVDQTDAIAAYRAFVHAGIGETSPLIHARGQLFLGDDTFLAGFQDQADRTQMDGITPTHRNALAPPLQTYLEKFDNRDEAMASAYDTCAYSITEIARHFNISDTTAARAIKRWQRRPGVEFAPDSGPDPGV